MQRQRLEIEAVVDDLRAHRDELLETLACTGRHAPGDPASDEDPFEFLLTAVRRACVAGKLAEPGAPIRPTADAALTTEPPERASDEGAASDAVGENRELISSIRRGEVDAVLGTGPMAGEVLVVNTLESEERRRGLIDDLRKEKQALEDFAFATAHDLRGPLTNIDTEIESLLAHHARLRLPLWFADSLRQIELASVRMRLLVSDLMMLGEIGCDAEPFETFELVDVIASVLDGLRPSIARSHVAVEIVDALPPVEGRVRQLEAIFENLIDNALRYAGTSSKGKVAIGCRHASEEVIVWVRDNGPGFDPREGVAVFEPYVRLDKRSDNTGLGLTIVRNAVAAHGGRVWIESAPGLGTTAFVAFPTARRAPATGAKGGAPLPARSP